MLNTEEAEDYEYGAVGAPIGIAWFFGVSNGYFCYFLNKTYDLYIFQLNDILYICK